MALFRKKLSQVEQMQFNNLLKQAQESAKLVNTTVKPDIFFGRLNFLFDVLYNMTKFEKKMKFKKGHAPIDDFNRLATNLELTVNDFIDRSYEKALEKVNSLKTEKGKKNHLQKYFDSMFLAFENSHSFWQGNNMSSHYTGILFTENNMKHLNDLYNAHDIK